MTSWEHEEQSQRRFPHGKAGRKKGNRQHGSGGGTFQPRNMLGHYSIRSPALEKLASAENQGNAVPSLWLEIHELVESQTGYFATFDFGCVSGVMLIAGSRRALQHIVDEAEVEALTDSEDGKSDDEESTAEDGSIVDPEHDIESDEASFVQPPDVDRPAHAFEKNTFRNPKWFARWRGNVPSQVASDRTEQDDDNAARSDNPDAELDNKAHFEFSSASCRDFEATFSCPELGLKEAAMSGWKTTSKPTRTAQTWNDFRQ